MSGTSCSFHGTPPFTRISALPGEMANCGSPCIQRSGTCLADRGTLVHEEAGIAKARFCRCSTLGASESCTEIEAGHSCQGCCPRLEEGPVLWSSQEGLQVGLKYCITYTYYFSLYHLYLLFWFISLKHLILYYIAYITFIYYSVLYILYHLYHFYILWNFTLVVMNIFIFHPSMSSNEIPGIRDGDILLWCGQDTPVLNIQAGEHAECRLRQQLYWCLWHIISLITLLSVIFTIRIIFFFDCCSCFVRNKRTSGGRAAANILSDMESEDDLASTVKASADQDFASPPRYNSKGLRVNANGVVSMRDLDLASPVPPKTREVNAKRFYSASLTLIHCGELYR